MGINMKKDKILQVRMDSELKKDAEKVFNALSINSSVAVNLFFKQVVLNQGIPFTLEIKKENKGSSYGKQ